MGVLKSFIPRSMSYTRWMSVAHFSVWCQNKSCYGRNGKRNKFYFFPIQWLWKLTMQICKMLTVCGWRKKYGWTTVWILWSWRKKLQGVTKVLDFLRTLSKKLGIKETDKMHFVKFGFIKAVHETQQVSYFKFLISTNNNPHPYRGFSCGSQTIESTFKWLWMDCHGVAFLRRTLDLCL